MGTMLAGKVAVITGAGRGIGQGVALLFAEEGAKVVVVDNGCDVDGRNTDAGPANDTVKQIIAKGGQAVAQTQGVETAAGGEAAIQKAIDTYGKLDILVAVHGILRDRMIFNMSEEEWDTVIKFHLKGVFNVLKPASVIMRQQRSGRIILFTSIAGLWGNSGQGNYGAAHAGKAGLMRVAARDLGRYGVTVNCIAPGRIMSEQIRRKYPEQFRAAESARDIPLGRYGEPEELACLAVFLASPLACYITGAVMPVDGGFRRYAF